jgi:hypothetical protein
MEAAQAIVSNTVDLSKVTIEQILDPSNKEERGNGYDEEVYIVYEGGVVDGKKHGFGLHTQDSSYNCQTSRDSYGDKAW